MVLFSDDEEDVNLEKIDISGYMPETEEEKTDSVNLNPQSELTEEPPLVTVDEVVKTARKTGNSVESENSVEAENSVATGNSVTTGKTKETGRKTGETSADEGSKKSKISIPVVRSSDEIPTGQQLEVDGMLSELDEIEAYLGMMSKFDDIKFPEPKPVVLPKVEQQIPVQMPIQMPMQQYIPQPVYTNVDVSKLDDEQLEMLMKKLNRVDELTKQVEELKNVIDDRLNLDFIAMYENILEKNNIEAIKTYRNVQAVIVEENAKQNRALFGIDGKSDSLKRRLNNVIIFSIISFVVSILVMLMQILPALGIDVF